MKRTTKLTFFGALLSLPLYGTPVDIFSCQFKVAKDGAPLGSVGSHQLSVPRLPAKFGPPVFQGQPRQPDREVPGFQSVAGVKWAPPDHEVDFYFSVNVAFAIRRDGSAAAQSSCIGQQATFHPEPGTHGLSLVQTDPNCGWKAVEPWTETGSLDHGWSPAALVDGTPVFNPKYLPPTTWVVNNAAHEYRLESSCQFLKTIP